ncbi:MAG: transcription-repair coupling factor [Actinobacteria bacterium]|nr:transcription-repair coupling factor [Actinomycetota bacterium]
MNREKMFSPLPAISFEHIARAFETKGHPCVQVLKAPAGARSFIVSRLLRRLARTVLVLATTTDEAEETFREMSAYLGPGGAPPSPFPGAPPPPPFPGAAVLFPSTEAAPYEAIPPYAPAVHDRVRALYRLAAGGPVAVVCSVEAAVEKTLPREVFLQAVRRVSAGTEIDVGELARHLSEAGYARLPSTAEPGDFSVRGGIVEVYSPGHPLPARLTLDGDRVESVRWFDPVSQRTLSRAGAEGNEGGELVILPCSQVITRPDYLSAAAGKAGAGLRDALRQGIRYHGIESALPHLYGRASSLFEYLPDDAVIAGIDSVACVSRARVAFADAEGNHARPGLPAGLPAPAELFVTPDELLREFENTALLCFDSIETAPFGRKDFVRGEIDAKGNDDIRRSTVASGTEGLLYPLAATAAEWWKRGDRFVVTSLTPSQTGRMEELLARYALPLSTGATLADSLEGQRGVALCCSEVTRGFRLPELRVAVVTETEVFGEKARARRGHRETELPAEEFSLREIRVNDLAVHVDHGVGVYRGLLRRAAAGVEGDFLVLEYAGGDRLFVPVEKMSRVQRYVASEEARPKLARLGGTAWQRAKQRVRDSLLAMAQDLVSIQAKRQLAVRPPSAAPDEIYREFEASFDHEETPDQQRAIREVTDDLTSPRPMDRLVCGDVGYGKTEVAIRAAFKVVQDGRQAAVLVPTTILAEQHYQTFCRRLSGYPVRVENLSRFRSKPEQASVVKELALGKVDIIVGTHRLLQKDVSFKDLALVVIDEEQRFGVAQKEKMKRLRAAVDVLTLSATPIPRTLHMAFSGIRDISIIATPPEDRLSIRTFVLPFSEETVREAVDREIRRGGQVFFVHNRVQTLPAMERFLKETLPEVRIGVAHGQMDEEGLALAMADFASRRVDLLLCTAIIEAGLDLPNANTILVNQAHRLGLAQLYQLRGRVGRDRHRAYAYFLVPKDIAITKEAAQRLAVLEELTELGSGFKIASHDLEIRGAGNLLGKDQSGQIHQVGYELYTQLLSETMAELSGRAAAMEEEPELDLRMPAFLPDDYIPEAGVRLDFYRKLAVSRTMDAADELELELLDRFGRLPGPARALCDLSRLRVLMRSVGVRELKRGNGSLFLTLSDMSEVDRGLLVQWVMKDRKKFHFVRGEVLAMRIPAEDPDAVLAAAKYLLNRFPPGRSI